MLFLCYLPLKHGRKRHFKQQITMLIFATRNACAGDSRGSLSRLPPSNGRIYFCKITPHTLVIADQLLAGGLVAGSCSQLTPAGQSGLVEGGAGRGTARVLPRWLFGIPMVSRRYSQPRDSHPLQERADSQGVPQACWPQLNNK